MPTVTEKDARRAAIVEAAAGVFLRYGFKKTSMDDLSRAAGLSRQGLYLHFPTKEALFRDVILALVETTQAKSRDALARADLPLEDRLVAMFDAIRDHAKGALTSDHMSELFETAATLVGSVLPDLENQLVLDLARALKDEGVAQRWKESGVSAKELAENLYSTSQGAKIRAKDEVEYRDRMRIAVRIVLGGKKRH